MSNAWLEGLNPAQKRAVEHGDGPLLIIAGAGTGKTRTLACRVASLIDRGVNPGRILLLTFTRRAAQEMLTRAAKLVGRSTGGGIWGGTFHAVANRLLRTYHRAVNLSPDFTVMDEADAADLMNLIRGELGVAKGDRRFPRKQTLVKVYSHTVNAATPLDEVLERHFPWCQDDIGAMRAIFELYVQRKKGQHLLDYDDLLLFWGHLCATSPAGERVADRFDHILVDEYQDTNTVQAEILRGMRKAHSNITVVGDDAQSIYSFRAATIRNILDFPEQFPGTEVIALEQNYRSTQPILAAANEVMKPAKERYTKELWSDRESETRPALITCLDEAGQTEAVCANIIDHFEQGIPLMRQAVLFRAGHHSAMLEVELASRNIPFHKYGGLKFIEASHIKDVLAMLRLLENPYDEISWFRVLQLLDGIGPRTARRIMDELNVRRIVGDVGQEVSPTGSPVARLLTDPPLPPQPARKQFTELRETLAYCHGVTIGDSGKGKRLQSKPDEQDAADETEIAARRRKDEPKLVTQIECLHRFYEPICTKRHDNAAARMRDVDQLGRIAARYRSRRRFIVDLTLDPPRATSDLAGPPHRDDDYLVLSTIHSAKGCEWDVVHILHAADGMIPSDMATEDDAGIDEERRLFYVAMTRAKDMLYVYFPLRYFHRRFGLSDAHNMAQLTRFLPPPARELFIEKTAGLGDGDDTSLGLPADSEPYSRINRLLRD